MGLPWIQPTPDPHGHHRSSMPSIMEYLNRRDGWQIEMVPDAIFRTLATGSSLHPVLISLSPFYLPTVVAALSSHDGATSADA
jgi:hypothetical protein